MAARKSPKQVRHLLSKRGPLTKKEKEKLRSEIRTGKVQIKGGKSAIGKKKSSRRRGRRR